MLGAALSVFLTGGFLLLVHIGASGRKAEGLTYGFGFRGATPAAAAATATTYLEDFKKGGEIVSRGAENYFGGFFGDSPQGDPSSDSAAAVPPEESGEDSGNDAFEKYYRSNYGSSAGKGGDSGAGSWADMGGGGFSASSGGGGGGGGGSDPVSPLGSSGKSGKKGGDGEAASSGAAAAGSAPGAGRDPGFRPAGALPGKKGPETAGRDPGRLDTSVNYGEFKPPKEGGSSGAGKGSGLPLDGAAESMKAGAEKNYDSKASGGAAGGVAAAGGAGGGAGGSGSAPAASGPKDATAEAAGGAAAVGTSSAAATAEAGEYTGDYSEFYAWNSGKKSGSDEKDLLAAVVTERRNGADAKFVSEEDAEAEPEEAQLKAGALAKEDPDKAADAEEEPVVDPVKLSALSGTRQNELKGEIHSFMKRVENRFGKMGDIYRTSCTAEPEVCKVHDVSGSYLTMTTDKGAKLVLGVKYVEGKWRRYTMDFKRPAGSGKKPTPQEEEEEVEE